MILITGANGYFGKATIDFLLMKGMQPADIAGLVRNEEKAQELRDKGAQVRIGDYINYDSLVNAFQGIDKLLLVSGTDVAQRSHQHENVIRAAKKAGIKHLLYTSFERKNESENSPIASVAASHLNTERAIRESGLTYTIFRNNLYMEYLPLFLGEKVLEVGVYFPAGDGKAAIASRTDMAEATANVLATSGHENKDYHMSNTEEVSFGDIAEILSSISGRKVPYISPDTNTYIETLVSSGVPKEMAQVSAAFGEAIKQGELSPETKDLEQLLGRMPTNIKEYLHSFYIKAGMKKEVDASPM